MELKHTTQGWKDVLESSVHQEADGLVFTIVTRHNGRVQATRMMASFTFAADLLKRLDLLAQNVGVTFPHLITLAPLTDSLSVSRFEMVTLAAAIQGVMEHGAPTWTTHPTVTCNVCTNPITPDTMLVEVTRGQHLVCCHLGCAVASHLL